MQLIVQFGFNEASLKNQSLPRTQDLMAEEPGVRRCKWSFENGQLKFANEVPK